MIIRLVFLLSMATFCKSQAYDDLIKGEWGYNQAYNGPSTWPYTHPLCGGRSQSPIEIITRAVEDDSTSGWISLNNYSNVRNSSLMNNGHTISFQHEGQSTNAATITGGHLKNQVYIFQQGHWHWGSSSDRGSEHHIDGLKNPMEIHLVHKNSKYPNLTEAFKHGDGVAVLAMFYEVSETDNTNLTQIISTLEMINNHPRANNESENIHVEMSGPMSVSQLLPGKMFDADYYHYQGSLTTPDCYESVTWTVLSAKIQISESQLDVFRKVKTLNGDKLNDNIRPVQELNGRIIQRVRANSMVQIGPNIVLIISIFLFPLLLKTRSLNNNVS